MLAQDDMLPLAVPVKNTRTGEMMTELPVKKGELIFISQFIHSPPTPPPLEVVSDRREGQV